MDNPGLKKGLAQDFGFNQGVADIARQNDQMRQAKLYAENQAKMMAEDFEYNNAMNAWDNTQVKQYAQGKIKELGSFIRENPDYKYNLDKRIIYNNLKRELKDNPYLNAGMQVDANIKAMQAYMNDPKNAPLVQSEEFTPIKQQYENYLKTGSIDGNTANRKLFTFTPPEELVDTTLLLAKYAQMTSLNGKDTKWLANGVGSIHQFVSDTDKAAAAEGAMNDKVLGRHLQKEYNDYISTVGEGQKPLSLKQYIVDKMRPYFKNDEYHNFNYATGERKSSKSGGAGDGTDKNYYAELIKHAKQSSVQQVKDKSGKVVLAPSGLAVNADPKGMDQILTGGKGKLNTNGMFFEATPGNFIPFNAGLVEQYTTAGSKVRHDPTTGKTYGTVDVQVPIDQIESYMGNADVIDSPTFGTGWIQRLIGMDKYGVNKEWKDKIKLDLENELASVTLTFPIDETSTNAAGGYNHGMGGKAEGVTSDIKQTISLSALKGQGYSDAQIEEIVNNRSDQYNFVP